MANKLKIFRGDTVKGTSMLRTIDPCDSSKMNTYVIPALADLTMNFPGGTGTPVSITSGAGEITVVDADKGQISWTLSAAKSATLTPVGDNQGLDLIVDDGGEITTFEKLRIVNIVDRVNG